jgi:drug/metabolite transporter (DMT)-like permease
MREETKFDRWATQTIGTGTRASVITYSFLAAAQTIFGGAAVIGKIGVNAIPPVIFATLRSSFSMIIMVVLMLFIARQKIREKKDIYWFAALGFTGVYGNQFMFTMGLAYAGPLLSAIMQPINPILTTFLAIVTRREPPSVLKIAGVLLAVVGTLIMVEIEKISFTSNRTLGLAFLLVQSIGNALYLIWAKPMFARYAPVFIVSMAYIFGATFMFVTFVIYAAAGGEMSMSMKSAWPIAYTVIFQSIIAYILTAFATKNTDVSIVAASSTLQPVVAAFLTWLVFDEVITWRDCIGVVLILAGLFAVCYQKYRDGKADALKKVMEEENKGKSNGGNSNANGTAGEVNGAGVEKHYPIETNDDHVIELEDGISSNKTPKGPQDIVNSRI